MGPLPKLVHVPLDGMVSFRSVAALLSFVSSASLLRVNLTLSSMSLMEILNNMGPLRAPLATDLHLHIKLFTSSLLFGCDHPNNSYFTEKSIHISPIQKKDVGENSNALQEPDR